MTRLKAMPSTGASSYYWQHHLAVEIKLCEKHFSLDFKFLYGRPGGVVKKEQYGRQR